ncbi:hypothetical protein [Metabacillus sp. RGM 3146]|uniref:hypothetical protein n=1 Tax=Metabacillus sp. RGM 3146 TaxID=3401092 RepID=UPI003B9BEFC9
MNIQKHYKKNAQFTAVLGVISFILGITASLGAWVFHWPLNPADIPLTLFLTALFMGAVSGIFQVYSKTNIPLAAGAAAKIQDHNEFILMKVPSPFFRALAFSPNGVMAFEAVPKTIPYFEKKAVLF